MNESLRSAFLDELNRNALFLSKEMSVSRVIYKGNVEEAELRHITPKEMEIGSYQDLVNDFKSTIMLRVEYDLMIHVRNFYYLAISTSSEVEILLQKLRLEFAAQCLR